MFTYYKRSPIDRAFEWSSLHQIDVCDPPGTPYRESA